jgi:hypothetical protein
MIATRDEWAQRRSDQRAAAKWQRQKFLQRIKIETHSLEFRAAVGNIIYTGLLTESEVATFLGLTVNTLRRYTGNPLFDPSLPW